MERLFASPHPVLDLSFAQIEAILARPLPASARRWRAWWANDHTHSQARQWMAAGYRVAGVDLASEQVRFERR